MSFSAVPHTRKNGTTAFALIPTGPSLWSGLPGPIFRVIAWYRFFCGSMTTTAYVLTFRLMRTLDKCVSHIPSHFNERNDPAHFFTFQERESSVISGNALYKENDTATFAPILTGFSLWFGLPGSVFRVIACHRFFCGSMTATALFLTFRLMRVLNRCAPYFSSQFVGVRFSLATVLFLAFQRMRVALTAWPLPHIFSQFVRQSAPPFDDCTFPHISVTLRNKATDRETGDLPCFENIFLRYLKRERKHRLRERRGCYFLLYHNSIMYVIFILSPFGFWLIYAVFRCSSMRKSAVNMRKCARNVRENTVGYAGFFPNYEGMCRNYELSCGEL